MKKLLLVLAVLSCAVSGFAQTHQVNLVWVNGVPNPACTVPLTTNLYRATVSGAEGSTPFKTGIPGAIYADASVLDATTYFYQVTNMCSTDNPNTESTKTAEIKVVVTAAVIPGPPPPPTGFSGAIGTLGASLMWTPVPNVNAYDIFKTGPAQGKWHWFASVSGKTSFLDTSAKVKGGLYQYVVASSDGTTDGPLSATVSVRHP